MVFGKPYEHVSDEIDLLDKLLAWKNKQEHGDEIVKFNRANTFLPAISLTICLLRKEGHPKKAADLEDKIKMLQESEKYPDSNEIYNKMKSECISFACGALGALKEERLRGQRPFC